MFENILGYDAIKSELRKFNDVMTNQKYYKDLGVILPKGIILYGEPGTGKTLCANELIEASGRTSYTIRCTDQISDLIESVVTEAKACQPAIILFDDLDKFGEARYDKIYDVVQANIDRVKDDDIFIIATANYLSYFPDSLLRPGRFDRKIEFVVPTGEDADLIIRHYLSNKHLDPNIDMISVLGLLNGKSCAQIESVINMAGLYAGYNRDPYITFNHILNATMAILYDKPETSYSKPDMEERVVTAYHEAGHAVMNELFNPGKTSIVSIRANNTFDGAFTSFEFYNMTNYMYVINDIMVTLAGSAAVQINFGYQCDIGARSDFRYASEDIAKLISEAGYLGLQCLVNLDNYIRPSEFNIYGLENLVHQETIKLYERVKSLLFKNWQFVVEIANALIEKETLVQSDIQAIKSKFVLYYE